MASLVPRRQENRLNRRECWLPQSLWNSRPTAEPCLSRPVIRRLDTASRSRTAWRSTSTVAALSSRPGCVATHLQKLCVRQIVTASLSWSRWPSRCRMASLSRIQTTRTRVARLGTASRRPRTHESVLCNSAPSCCTLRGGRAITADLLGKRTHPTRQERSQSRLARQHWPIAHYRSSGVASVLLLG